MSSAGKIPLGGPCGTRLLWALGPGIPLKPLEFLISSWCPLTKKITHNQYDLLSPNKVLILVLTNCLFREEWTTCVHGFAGSPCLEARWEVDADNRRWNLKSGCISRTLQIQRRFLYPLTCFFQDKTVYGSAQILASFHPLFATVIPLFMAYSVEFILCNLFYLLKLLC